MGMLMMSLTGCSTVRGIFGKTSVATQKSVDKIELAQNEISQNTTSNIDLIAGLSFGTDYALNKITNPVPAVNVAKELNNRVQSLAGMPSLDQQKEMWVLINNLISSNQSLVRLGDTQLAEKDQTITALQLEKRDLEINKDKRISDFINQATITALKTDTLSSQLASYTGFWGISAIVKGSVSLIKHLMWTLIIITVVYAILRGLADTYPPAGIIFSIFSKIGSVFIQFIEYLIPKSITELGLVSNEAYSEVTNELAKLKADITSAALSNSTVIVQTVPPTVPVTGSLK